MAGKKGAKQKAGPRDRTERAQKRNPGEPEKEPQWDSEEQGEPRKTSLTKRRQARRVAMMVKRLRKNPEESEQQHKAEAKAGQTSGGGWDAQQQATVAAYAHSRGMQPQEVLQALCQLNREDLAQREEWKPSGPDSVTQREPARGRWGQIQGQVQPWKREKRLEGKGSRTQLHCT